MKKLLNIFILILCISLAGCDGDESNGVSLLKVIQSDATFQAAGGEGSIRIEATGEVTAVSNADWCTIKGTTNEMISFKVDVNYDYPGRSTQIIIKNETGIQKVTIIQQGAIIIYDENDLQQAVGNEKNSLTLALSASLPFEVNIPEAAKNWLSYEIADNGIQFNFEENTTNAPRGTDVEITNGQRTAIFSLMQYDADDLVGSWVASFNRYWQNSNTNGKGPASIVKNTDGTYLITLPVSSYFPLTFRATYEDNGFKIAAQQFIGETEMINDNDGSAVTLYLYLGLASEGYMYWFSTQSASLAPSMVNGEIALTIHDNGSAPGDTISDLLMGFFLKKGDISQSSFVSSLTMDIYNLKLYK